MNPVISVKHVVRWVNHCHCSFQVQGLNSQWQKYDSSREEYIRELCQRLKMSGQGLTPGLGSVNSGVLHQEISRLNSLLEEKTRECEQLDRELEDARRRGQEQIQTLKQQVSVTLWTLCTCVHLRFPKFFYRRETDSGRLKGSFPTSGSHLHRRL